MSLCGPTNALQKLTNHTQLDRSLQQDHQQRVNNVNNNSFKQINTNQQLENEFFQQQQQQFNPIFQNSFQLPQHHQQPNLTQQQYPNQQNVGAKAPANWSNEFAKLSISNSHSQISHQGPIQHTNNDWSSSFMTQQHQGQHFQGKQNTFSNPSLQYRASPQMQPNYASQLSSQHNNFKTEHQELHDVAKFHNDLSSEFARVEEELNQRPLKEEIPIPNKSNEQFRNAASEIRSVMTQSNDSKFANSKFLQLMSLVSDGQVELNEDETKLIDNNGNDIQSLSNETSDDVHTNTLPDPLAGLTSEDLSSPFESAKKVGELRSEKYTWDDVYDDYKHDDSSF